MTTRTDNKLLRLGHSPDPDDAFMFYGLAKELLDTRGWRFEHVLQDIQTLNDRAMRGELEITAISIHAYPYVADKYALTSCGSSMGDKYGPMIVTRSPMKLDELKGKTIAIPGELTTAFLAMQLCIGKGEKEENAERGMRNAERQTKERDALIAHRSSLSTLDSAFSYVLVPFDEIPKFVADGKADAGLLIHEGQLTYKQAGLHLVVDLGAWWHERTGLPLPLGGNCIRRDLGKEAMQEITDVLKESIQFSLDHRAEAVEYALQFGRDLNRDLADKFVGMYVNQWTLDYGPRGREAISRLLREGAEAGLVPAIGEIDFVTAR
jgi:1,4-dihydroxy-6-naphthoate synthase